MTVFPAADTAGPDPDRADPAGPDLDRVGSAYLGHLTDADLAVLVHADEVPADRAAARVAALRREPALVLDVLDRPATSAAILALGSEPGGGTANGMRQEPRFAFISPFLVFAAAVHRTAADLAGTPYALERAAGRMRVPVFDSADLTAYLARAERRLVLAELLASYARVSSGVAVTRTRTGVRRRRWNDLDPVRLAVLLEALPEDQRPGVWRRLGDLALFLTGVFPDAAGGLRAVRLDAGRLARLTGVRERPDPDQRDADALEWLGARWYRLAAGAGAGVAGVGVAGAGVAGVGVAGVGVAGVGVAGAAGAGAGAAADRAAADLAAHFRQARRVLNAVTDRYLFPVTTSWFGAA